jgi:ubiquinone/menaquinone biosynthesis C-methylase UbiE
MLRRLLVLLLAVAVTTAAAREADAPQYSRGPASAGGTGKLYMEREIAQVMSYHGAPWLERAERSREERPDLVLAALDLQSGMSVADIGAGTGYYARRIAERVGPGGVVYAVDVQPEMVKLMARELARGKIGNVKPVQGSATDPALAPASIDLAVMIDVYHELEYPREMLAAIVRALKPGGRVAFVEFRADDPAVPIRQLHTMSEAQVRREADASGLQWMKTEGNLPWQNVIVFRKRD